MRKSDKSVEYTTLLNKIQSLISSGAYLRKDYGFSNKVEELEDGGWKYEYTDKYILDRFIISRIKTQTGGKLSKTELKYSYLITVMHGYPFLIDDGTFHIGEYERIYRTTNIKNLWSTLDEIYDRQGKEEENLSLEDYLKST